MILGLDTASVAGNKNPNWVQAKAAGLSFAIIRSNYGNSKDSTFGRDWPRIQDAGITRGAYLFFRFPHPKHDMKCPTPEAQAEAVCNTVKLEEGDLPPTLDVEFPGDKRFPNKTGRELTGFTAAECLARVITAYDILRDHYGRDPIVYTSARVWKEDLKSLPAPELLGCPLWLARYRFKKGPAVTDGAPFATGKLDPPVPTPWGDADNWWIHQYQGDAKGYPGFATGNLDMNRFHPMIKGATGARVKWVQGKLGVKVDGKFGAGTEKSLRAFQKQHGLVADGVIGPRTFARLCAR